MFETIRVDRLHKIYITYVAFNIEEHQRQAKKLQQNITSSHSPRKAVSLASALWVRSGGSVASYEDNHDIYFE